MVYIALNFNQIVGLLILLFLIAALPVYYAFTYKDESFWITIEGDILPTKELLDKKSKNPNIELHPPKFVTIKHYVDIYYNFQAKGKIFSTTNITWTDNLKGYYKQTLQIPRELDLFLYSQEEFLQIVEIDNKKTNYKVDLYWDGFERKKSYPTLNVEEEKKRINAIRTRVLRAKNEVKFDDNITKLIDDDIQTAEDLIQRADYESATTNETLKGLLYGEWFLLRAKYRIEYFKLKECAESNEKIIKKNYSNLFYNKPYEQNFLIDTSHASLTSFYDWYIAGNFHIYQYEELEKIKNEIQLLDEEQEKLRKKSEDCNSILLDVLKIYKFQENLFRKRLITIFLYTLLMLLAGIIISNFIGTNHIYNYVTSLNFESRITNFFRLRDFYQAHLVITTILIGLVAGNTAMLQTGMSQIGNLGAYLSISFAIISLIIALLDFSQIRRKPSTPPTAIISNYEKWLLFFMTLSFITFPIIFVFIINLINGFVFIIKSFLNIFIKFLSGRW